MKKLTTKSFSTYSECIGFLYANGCQKPFTELLTELNKKGYSIFGSYHVVYDPKDEYERVKRQIEERKKAEKLSEKENN